MKSFALILALAAVAEPALSKDVPVNEWVLVEDATDGGTPSGFCYVPDERGMLLWGRRARRDWRGRELSKRYWVELFDTTTHRWKERVPDAGRLEAGLGRHSYY